MAAYLAFFPTLGPMELLVIGLIALLIFGARLPEVGRSVGRGLLELKKGLSGIRDEMDEVRSEADRRVDEELARRAEDRIARSAERPSLPDAEAVFGVKPTGEDAAPIDESGPRSD